MRCWNDAQPDYPRGPKDPSACIWKSLQIEGEKIARFAFLVDLCIPPHTPLLLLPAPAVRPAKLSPLGGLTIPAPFSDPGLCPTSLGDAVPLPGTGLLSCGAAPCAWLLNALIWKGFLTGEVVWVREGSSVGEGARLPVLIGEGLGGGCGWD